MVNLLWCHPLSSCGFKSIPDNSLYVLNLLAETVYYDDAECDGNCLMEDIDAWMYERGIDYDTTRD